MIIQREFEAGGFHVASDGPFLDNTLSWEARGVLGYLFTKPDDWTPRIYDLVNNGPCEKHKIKSIFSELENAGYLHRRKFRNEDGTFDWQVKIFDHPRSDPGWTQSTPDGVHPGRDRGYNNTDSQSDGQSTNTDTQARAREDDPPGVRIWREVTGDRPPVTKRQTMKDAFTDGGLRWDADVFQRVMKSAYRNVDQNAKRVKVGYLIDEYKRKLPETDTEPEQVDRKPKNAQSIRG
jgi:hypothetical protein